MMRALVTGSRGWIDVEAITRLLDELFGEYGAELVVLHGGCPSGADKIADDWCRRPRVSGVPIPVEVFPADWSAGKVGGQARNAAMVATRPDLCLAFILDGSPGATGCARLAEEAGIPTIRHTATSPATRADFCRDVLSVIEEAYHANPRNHQAAIGMSEIGTPCPRKLAYRLGGQERINPARMSWRSFSGTAIHAYLADIFTQANSGRTRTRWLTEHSVTADRVGDGPLLGHTDLYDTQTGNVLDWKNVSRLTMKSVRGGVIPPGYRVQAHCYGRGWELKGYEVDRVYILFMPQGGEVEEFIWWNEPYDRAVALKAMARANQLYGIGQVMGFKSLAEMTTPVRDYCEYCPWYSPLNSDPSLGRCPGAPELATDTPTNYG